MFRDEFERGVLKLESRWKNFAAPSQLEIFWDKWRGLPDDVFRFAVESILFKCTATPSGEKIQEEINLLLEKRSRQSNSEKPRHNGCKSCDGQGYQYAYKSNGNSTVCLCTSCAGKGANFNYPLPRYAEIELQGYKLKKPLSFEARKLPVWRDYDQSKFSPKLGGIFYTVQRALLTKDVRGIKGIKKLTGMNSAELMKLYELIAEGNTNHALVKKHNDIALNFENQSQA